MLGLLLPLVIFLQSVLSLSALQAGLILAPMSLASVVSAPYAGRLADRLGGKDILVVGLLLWAGGIALVLSATRPYSSLAALIAGLVIAGLGLGMTFAPLQTIAMHNVAGPDGRSRRRGDEHGPPARRGARLGRDGHRPAGPAGRAPGDSRPSATPRPSPRASGRGSSRASRKRPRPRESRSGPASPARTCRPTSRPPCCRPSSRSPLKTFHEAYLPAMRATLMLPLVVLALAVVGALFVRRSDPDQPVRNADRRP